MKDDVTHTHSLSRLDCTRDSGPPPAPQRTSQAVLAAPTLAPVVPVGERTFKFSPIGGSVGITIASDVIDGKHHSFVSSVQTSSIADKVSAACPPCAPEHRACQPSPRLVFRAGLCGGNRSTTETDNAGSPVLLRTQIGLKNNDVILKIGGVVMLQADHDSVMAAFTAATQVCSPPSSRVKLQRLSLCRGISLLSHPPCSVVSPSDYVDQCSRARTHTLNHGTPPTGSTDRTHRVQDQFAPR